MKPLSITLAVALLGTSGVAAAQTAADARCIVLALGFADRAADPHNKKLAEDSLYFYLGRVGGEADSAQLKAALDAEAKAITDANADTLMSECVAAVNRKVQLLRSVATAPPKVPASPQGR